MTKQTYEDVPLGRLLYEIARIWRSRIDVRLQAMSLSQARLQVIISLDGLHEEGLNQREIARACGVEPPTMANLLERMEREGWILRRPCLNDRRSKRVLLTPRAIEAREQIRREAQGIEDEIFDDLPEENYKQIRTGLTLLRQLLDGNQTDIRREKE
jgi:MarR family transcriptional regulator for hemolysin